VILVTTAVNLTPGQKHKLKRAGRKTDRSMGSLIRALVDDYLDALLDTPTEE